MCRHVFTPCQLLLPPMIGVQTSKPLPKKDECQKEVEVLDPSLGGPHRYTLRPAQDSNIPKTYCYWPGVSQTKVMWPYRSPHFAAHASPIAGLSANTPGTSAIAELKSFTNP